jgi:hypothetical protein
MSAAGRIILSMLGLSLATSMMSSQTAMDVAGPRHQTQRQGQGSDAPSSVKSVPTRPAEAPYSTIEPTVVTVVDRATERFFRVGQPLLPRNPEAIARELQKELKRVGCYGGELNGVWTMSTREAMRVFSDRVNAKLPIDKPDTILLALVQGHSEKVCGVPCPSGQSLSHTQQCTPNALLVASGKTKAAVGPGQARAQATSAWTVKSTVAGGALVPQAGTEHPGDVAPVVPLPSAAGTPTQAPHRVARRQSPTPSHAGTWASTFFKQRDRFGLN